MAAYPTTLVNTKFKAFFSKIWSVGIPTCVDRKWLLSYGFTTQNDNGLISVLKFLGFIDSQCTPTGIWHDFKTQKTDQLSMSVLTEAYRDLFEHTPTAQEASKEDLAHFFRSKTPTSGNVTIQRQVANFLSLAAITSFESGREVIQPNSVKVEIDTPKSNHQVAMPRASICQTTASNGLTLNLNIQLTLPETADASMVDQIFAAMGKHLLKNS